MKSNAFVIVLIILALTFAPTQADKAVKLDPTPDRILVLDGSNVHNVGQLLMHVSNWGEVGSRPGSALPYSHAPSAEWPAASGNEHLFTAGLWIGALEAGVPKVSTAAFETEFRPTPDPVDVIYRSAEGDAGGNRLPDPNADDDADGATDEDWRDGRDNDNDALIDEDFAAISNQMFSCWYTDNQPISSQIFPNHSPMDLQIRQETYQWQHHRFDDFVGVMYEITNIGNNILEDVYVGIFMDPDIGNRNTPSYWNNDASGQRRDVQCTDLGPVTTDIGYAYDTGAVTSYFGFQWVGHPTDPSGEQAPTQVGLSTFATFSGAQSYEDGGDPTNDFERYEAMSSQTIDRGSSVPRDWRMLLVAGPFAELRPGETLTLHGAFVAGNGEAGLVENAANAALAFEGQWFDVDGDPLTGIAGRETRVDGPAEAVPVNPCSSDPPIPWIPRGESVYINWDCADELFYESECGYLPGDSLLAKTGVAGKETQVNWYVEPEGTVPVFFQSFSARPASDVVHLSWELVADEPVRGFKVYRRAGDGPESEISGGRLDLAARRYDDRAVETGIEYVYSLAVVLDDGTELRAASQFVMLSAASLGLVQNKPNPFNPETTIAFSLAERGPVNIVVYDAAGRRVATLVDKEMSAGPHEIGWDARDTSGRTVRSGVYFYRMIAGGQTLSRKMVVLR